MIQSFRYGVIVIRKYPAQDHTLKTWNWVSGPDLVVCGGSHPSEYCSASKNARGYEAVLLNRWCELISITNGLLPG